MEASLETGARRGELLSLQWKQIRSAPKPEILFPAQKTKTKTARSVPISTRLKAILDMRKTAPHGTQFGPDDYVFGNEIGERITSVKTACCVRLLYALERSRIFIASERAEWLDTTHFRRTRQSVDRCRERFRHTVALQ